MRQRATCRIFILEDVPNKFPYDAIAQKHDMLVPLRHATEKELTEEERKEFEVIKDTYLPHYDFIMQATGRAASIPDHFHIHLVVGKEE